MASYTEEKPGQAGRYDAKPDSVRTEKTVAMNTQGLDMHMNAPETNALDSNKGSGTVSMMKRAVDHLNRETQRTSE